MHELLPHQAIVIGVSAGGMQALTEIFSRLSPDFQIPIIVIQHLHPHQGSFHIEYFMEIAPIPVQEIREKERLQNATIYFAPPNYHVLIEKDKTFALTVDEKVNYARPSIDVFFNSISEVFNKNLTGIILTGANRDGATGLAKIRQRGGKTIIQSLDNAQFMAMPTFALDAVPDSKIMTLTEIADFLIYLNNTIRPQIKKR